MKTYGPKGHSRSLKKRGYVGGDEVSLTTNDVWQGVVEFFFLTFCFARWGKASCTLSSEKIKIKGL